MSDDLDAATTWARGLIARWPGEPAARYLTTLVNAAEGMHPDTGPARDPIVAATDLLFEHRHTLPADVLRSMAGIWVCASAAKYGEPYERFWEDDPFAGHDTDECEAENATTPSRALLGADTTPEAHTPIELRGGNQ